jgi:hypothetical protein
MTTKRAPVRGLALSREAHANSRAKMAAGFPHCGVQRPSIEAFQNSRYDAL